MTFVRHLTGPALAISLAVAGGEARAELVLSYSPWNPATYGANDAIYPWFDQVALVTEGRVRVEPRAAGVGSPRDQAEAVSSGLVDLSLVVTGYTPGRYPMMDLFSLPMLSADGEALSIAAAEIFETHFARHAMFTDAVPLTVFVGVPAQLAAIKAPLTEGKAVSGQKLYISNRPTSTLLASLGASPVSATVAEVFGMASGGIIDGAVFGFESTQTFALDAYLRHFTLVEGGLGQASWVFLVNRDSWEKISAADQEAIMGISGKVLAGQVGAALMGGETRARAALEAGGVTVTPAPKGLMAALRSQVVPVYAAWESAAAAAGLDDPAGVLADLQARLR